MSPGHSREKVTPDNLKVQGVSFTGRMDRALRVRVREWKGGCFSGLKNCCQRVGRICWKWGEKSI